jgi:3-isopropylmalate/(R)-2-methylmalate dehydratase small subunit
MEPFKQLTALACPLPLENVDTDQIVPARFMSTPRSQGYGGFLLHDLRRGPDGVLTGALPLDHAERKGAKILVARRNFGCGSSREAAVYALVDSGFRCVIAPSFGEIFAGNALNNGLVTAVLSDAAANDLIESLEAGLLDLTVDLEACTITAATTRIPFQIDPAARKRLLNGWDDLDLTTSFGAAIAAWSTADAAVRPWAQPDRVAS